MVAALARQAAVLNTNTRYLHPHLVEYARRLTATMPDPLEVCFFVNSGSEANELALRLARTHTARRDVVVVEHAYHGNTSSLVELSPYKAEGPGGSGLAEWAHAVPFPDPYRGAFRGAGSGPAYVECVRETCARLVAEGRPPAAFFAESLPGVGGQIVPPAGWLAGAFDAVRAAGGVAVADEVQVGFGRVGTHWWAFEAQGALPDVVTLGKPIGNGHPLGAVVTTRAIAESFANGMEFFNTFGGNPVSCAVGLAVLDVIRDEGLCERAERVGARLRDGFVELARERERAASSPFIGDVRGLGLFCGVELVRDLETREPAGREAAAVVEAALAAGVLLSVDGPHANVLKIKPPLAFGPAEAELLLGVVGRALARS